MNIALVPRVAVAVVLAAVATACGKFHTGGGLAPAMLIFSNQGLDQAAVYVVSPGADFRRIGTVMAGRTDTLKVDPGILTSGGSLNVVARILAHPDMPQTGPVTMEPGGSYKVTLGSDERMLSFLPAP